LKKTPLVYTDNDQDLDRVVPVVVIRSDPTQSCGLKI